MKFLRKIFRRCLRLVAHHLYPILPGTSLSWGPPRRFEARFKDWINSNNNSKYGKLFSVIQPSEFTLSLPITVDHILPRNLATRHIIELEEQYVAVIPGGRVVGCEPSIITGDDTILGDLSMMFAPYFFDIFFQSKLPDILSVPDPVLVLAGMPGENYGHWLHQMLPRLHLALKAGWHPSDFSKVIINNTPNKFAEESLLAAGFLSEQLIPTSIHLHIKGHPLVVPSIPYAGNPPEWISEFLRYTYGKDNVIPRRLIYTSRANCRWRKISNETELIPILEEFGFEIVYPETLNFMEGVRLFETAAVVCGMHGANLSNLCFCKPGSLLIEIYHPQQPETYFWSASTGASLKYSFLLGEGPLRDFPDLAPGSIANHCDTVVDPKKLRKTFLAAGLTPRAKLE